MFLVTKTYKLFLDLKPTAHGDMDKCRVLYNLSNNSSNNLCFRVNYPDYCWVAGCSSLLIFRNVEFPNREYNLRLFVFPILFTMSRLKAVCLFLSVLSFSKQQWHRHNIFEAIRTHTFSQDFTYYKPPN